MHKAGLLTLVAILRGCDDASVGLMPLATGADRMSK